MEAIRVEGLGRRFGELVAVDDLSFKVAPGEIFGLVGPDGAGKTTTLRMLAGILEPTSGRAWVENSNILEESTKDCIGYMSQRFGLYPDLSVQENLDFYAELYGVPRSEWQNRMDRVLAFSNLTPFRRRQAGNLSGGMKQKLGLACALIHTPQVLLLDEPTNGVDPVSRRDFWRILYQLQQQGTTILVSTAYLDEAERCSRVGLMSEGRLMACGRVTDIKAAFQHRLLEIRVPNPRAAASCLRLETPHSVALFGDRLHLALDHDVAEAESQANTVTALLKARGMEPQSRWVDPSLEDVFMTFCATAQHEVQP